VFKLEKENEMMVCKNIELSSVAPILEPPSQVSKMVKSKDKTLSTWSKCGSKFVKLVMKALTMGLSGKLTMLVAISHRPEKGHCS
jgi:hypothetical protein